MFSVYFPKLTFGLLAQKDKNVTFTLEHYRGVVRVYKVKLGTLKEIGDNTSG